MIGVTCFAHLAFSNIIITSNKTRLAFDRDKPGILDFILLKK